jgi:hypothetical protein
MMRLAVAERQKNVDTARENGRWPGRAQLLPNLRLDDLDLTGVFTYLDERNFEGSHLVATPESVRAQLMRSTPMLPQWFIDGVTELCAQAVFRGEPITLQPFRWLSREETEALKRDFEARRVLLAPIELFAPDALYGPGREHAVRMHVWRAQAVLFARWAFDPANEPASGGFWKLARRARQEALTEKIFVECFGFGYSELRDRLSDYLPLAVKEPVRISPGKLGPLPRIEVTPATPAQIGRLQGEWERLEIDYVRRLYPDFLSAYVRQARGTLQRALARSPGDTGLIAALGLCELDAGEVAQARPWLEQAWANRAQRPRACYELARLRWADLVRDVPQTQLFSAVELSPTIEPLRAALAQRPLLPEVVLFLAEVWLRCDTATAPPELPELVQAARGFHRLPPVGYGVALLLAKYEHDEEAEGLLSRQRGMLADPGMRTRFSDLQKALEGRRTSRGRSGR